MEGRFNFTSMENDRKDEDDNDSFIAIEKQAMREDVESEIGNSENSFMQEHQSEIEQLKTNLNEAIEEKNNAVSQLDSKDNEIKKLNEVIQNLKFELQSY